MGIATSSVKNVLLMNDKRTASKPHNGSGSQTGSFRRDACAPAAYSTIHACELWRNGV